MGCDRHPEQGAESIESLFAEFDGVVSSHCEQVPARHHPRLRSRPDPMFRSKEIRARRTLRQQDLREDEVGAEGSDVQNHLSYLSESSADDRRYDSPARTYSALIEPCPSATTDLTFRPFP